MVQDHERGSAQALDLQRAPQLHRDGMPDAVRREDYEGHVTGRERREKDSQASGKLAPA